MTQSSQLPFSLPYSVSLFLFFSLSLFRHAVITQAIQQFPLIALNQLPTIFQFYFIIAHTERERVSKGYRYKAPNASFDSAQSGEIASQASHCRGCWLFRRKKVIDSYGTPTHSPSSLGQTFWFDSLCTSLLSLLLPLFPSLSVVRCLCMQYKNFA